MIEVLILKLKTGIMLIHQKRDQLVVCLVRKMQVIILLGLIVAIDGGKGVHMVNDFLNVRSKRKGNGQAQLSDPSFQDPKRNHFYALKIRG